MRMTEKLPKCNCLKAEMQSRGRMVEYGRGNGVMQR